MGKLPSQVSLMTAEDKRALDRADLWNKIIIIRLSSPPLLHCTLTPKSHPKCQNKPGSRK